MFRWLTLVTVATTIGISAHYRLKARRLGGTIERRREGWPFALLRAAVALPMFGSILLYILDPAAMQWASFNAPRWLRGIGAALGMLSVPAAWWVFTSIGSNVSETVLTKPNHQLVTTGPYRWIRHPLYATGAMLLVGAGLMAANWFILLWAALGIAMIRIVVIPKEEGALVAKFGDTYRTYMARTGRLLPRFTTGRMRDRRGTGAR